MSATVDLDEYRISSAAEVQALLKQLQDKGTLVTLSGPGGLSYTTVLWSADTQRKVLSFSAESGDQRLQQLLESDEVVAVAYLDAIKLQFDVLGAMLVRGGQTTITARYPEQLYRFQRRSSFRVKPLGKEPTIRFKHPAHPATVLTLRVLDISLGGVACLMPDNVPPMPAGSTARNCLLTLDEETTLEVDMVIHHVSVMNPEVRSARLGCELINLRGSDERALQNYINLTQKRRIALTR